MSLEILEMVEQANRMKVITLHMLDSILSSVKDFKEAKGEYPPGITIEDMASVHRTRELVENMVEEVNQAIQQVMERVILGALETDGEADGENSTDESDPDSEEA